MKDQWLIDRWQRAYTARWNKPAPEVQYDSAGWYIITPWPKKHRPSEFRKMAETLEAQTRAAGVKA